MTSFLHSKERRMRVKLSQQWYQEKRFLFIYFFCNSIQSLSSLMVHVFLNKWQLTDFNLVSDSKVIRRLRERGEPIRLFGESDDEACQRLRLTEGVVFVAGKEKAHLTSPPKKKKIQYWSPPSQGTRNINWMLRELLFSVDNGEALSGLCVVRLASGSFLIDLFFSLSSRRVYFKFVICPDEMLLLSTGELRCLLQKLTRYIAMCIHNSRALRTWKKQRKCLPS